jgi:hypothetical protein
MMKLHLSTRLLALAAVLSAPACNPMLDEGPAKPGDTGAESSSATNPAETDSNVQAVSSGWTCKNLMQLRMNQVYGDGYDSDSIRAALRAASPNGRKLDGNLLACAKRTGSSYQYAVWQSEQLAQNCPAEWKACMNEDYIPQPPPPPAGKVTCTAQSLFHAEVPGNTETEWEYNHSRTAATKTAAEDAVLSACRQVTYDWVNKYGGYVERDCYVSGCK